MSALTRDRDKDEAMNLWLKTRREWRENLDDSRSQDQLIADLILSIDAAVRREAMEDTPDLRRERAVGEKIAPWPELVEKIRRDHNGVMSVDLHFGHDGDNTCSLGDYSKILATYSCDSMHRSVERAIEGWLLEKSADWIARHDWTEFIASLVEPSQKGAAE